MIYAYRNHMVFLSYLIFRMEYVILYTNIKWMPKNPLILWHFVFFATGYTYKCAASAAKSSYKSEMGSPFDCNAEALNGTPAAEQGYTPKP